MKFSAPLIPLLALLTVQTARPAVFELPAGGGPAANPSAETLAHHLATNAAGRMQSRDRDHQDLRPLSGWGYAEYSGTNLARLTNAVWSANFWLAGVRGLGATSIGLSNGMGGQGMMTMVSPRHYLCATHMHPEAYLAAFLDSHNVIHWRTTLQRVDVSGDVSVGLLNADLPPSVSFLPVLPADYSRYLPTNSTDAVQGLGMNQDLRIFSQPMNFSNPQTVLWNSQVVIPAGLGTNWSIAIRAGDSSNPEMLLIRNQLVLVSHNSAVAGGPNYAHQLDEINRAMHQLSVSHHTGTDYQLTQYPLTNWPVVNP